VLSGCCGDVFKAGLQGSKFTSISRHGKYLVFTLTASSPQCKQSLLIIHLRMTGRLYLVPQSDAIERHTRLVLMLEEGLALRFDDPRKFGRVWLVQDQEEVTGGLGPDALSVDFDYFSSELSMRSRQIKPLLLDQSFIAGIGNIYADESLFRAGIHPLKSTEELTDFDISRLYHSIAGVLSEAVDTQGANIDGVFKEGSFIVSVYGQTGKPCPVCETSILKIRVGQRGTHYCPACQPR
jgi:formamidopyrimidine-DNA glycosylase